MTISETTTSEGRGCASLDVHADLHFGLIADGEGMLSWLTMLLKLEAEVGTMCQAGTAKYDLTVAAGQYDAANVEMRTKSG